MKTDREYIHVLSMLYVYSPRKLLESAGRTQQSEHDARPKQPPKQPTAANSSPERERGGRHTMRAKGDNAEGRES